jgi:hypothetical protein
MKQKSLRCTIMAAVLALAASAAYSQENGTAAKIPFAFRAAGSDLPAGRYRVGPTTGDSVDVQLQNLDSGKTMYLQAKSLVTESKESKDARPRLIFQCGGEEGCSLAKLWSGTGAGLEFPTPKLTANQRERRETIYLDRFKEK